MIKIVGISGSPRKEKNTEFLVKLALESIKEKEPSVETVFIPLSEKYFLGCLSCGYCHEHYGCSQKDDLYPVLEQLKDETIKGLIIGSPVYMGGMSSQTKAFLDRTVLFRRNQFKFQHLLGGALATGGSRNGGQELVLQNIHASLMIHNMIIVPDSAPTSHFGGAVWERVPGGMENDPIALETVKNLGYNMASLIQKMFLK